MGNKNPKKTGVKSNQPLPVIGKCLICNIPMRFQSTEEEEPVDLVAVKAEPKEIGVKKQAAIDKAEGFLKELGL